MVALLHVCTGGLPAPLTSVESHVVLCLEINPHVMHVRLETNYHVQAVSRDNVDECLVKIP